jgi:hypothetical protein
VEATAATRESRARSWSRIEICSPADALRRDTVDIRVPEDEELVLSPDDDDLSRCFARVTLESFADLKVLGLVPRAASEDRIRAAMAADDDATYQRVGDSSAGAAPDDCGCSGSASETGSLSVRGASRRRYEQVRTFHNPALARELSEHYQTTLAWDDPVVAVVHKWVTKTGREAYVNRPYLIGLFEDITVEKGATLSLEKGLTALYAHDVWIHRRGRIVQRGSYMKLWAATVSSFRDLPDIVKLESPAPWRLTA